MPRPKLLLFVGAMVALSFFVVAELLRELASPEQRIRFVLEDAVDDFNDRRADSVLRVFARRFEDESGGHDRDDVLRGLHMLLWAGGHRYEVELREEQLDIEVAEGGKRAEVAVGLAFWRDDEKGGAPWWDLRAVLDFERKGSEWRIVRSRDVNHHERGR